MPLESQEDAIIVSMPVNNIMTLQLCRYKYAGLYSRIEWGSGIWSEWIKH